MDRTLHSGVMAHRCWDESYASGELPWDTGEPEPLLVEFVTSGRVQPTRALEIGVGTGTNAIWLAERAFDVLGIDVASLAIEQANAKLEGRALRCRFAALDFLSAAPPGGPFEFVFDRGCFHVFDEPEERGCFAAQVAAALAPGGLWLSLIGSAEGGPRDKRVSPPVVEATKTANSRRRVSPETSDRGRRRRARRGSPGWARVVERIQARGALVPWAASRGCRRSFLAIPAIILRNSLLSPSTILETSRQTARTRAGRCLLS